VLRQRYTVGFNSSPINRVTVSGRYRKTIRSNDYNHHTDAKTAAGVPVENEGYSAFIKEQKFDTDEITAKLTIRPSTRISVALQYQLVSTDIDTETDSVPALGIPAGTVSSGNYDANVYSISVTVTPVARLYLTGSFSFHDTRTIAYDHNARSVITYRGDVYSVIASSGYALDNKTDLNVQYNFSRSDNSENNSFDNTPPGGSVNNDYGLALGLDNERHGVVATLTRKITDNIIARLRYGFFYYDENSNGGYDDYTAHLVSGACTFRF
jgi:hypothetical protein